jgi:hypothetical protein
MPRYKNRAPMDEAIELRRYTTIDALAPIFRNRKLRLTRVDKFPDSFEGSVPKKQIDDQLPIFSSRNADQMRSVAAYYPGMSIPPRRDLDPWTEMTLWRRAKTRSAHSSEAHRDAYIEERARVLFWEKIREHIKNLPEPRTPAREAEEWASIAIAHASVTSRKEVARNSGKASSDAGGVITPPGKPGRGKSRR